MRLDAWRCGLREAEAAEEAKSAGERDAMFKPMRSSHAAAFICVLPGILFATHFAGAAPSPEPASNIVLIIIDDHGANFTSVRGESAARTPAMEHLAAAGTWFSHAYCAAPACNPSRAAFLTGVGPDRSGVYFNTQGFRRSSGAIARAVSVHQQFLRNGYLVAGFGKIYHTEFQEDDVQDFTPGYFYGHNLKKYVRYNDRDLLPHVIPGTLRGIEGIEVGKFGALPNDWDRDEPEKQQQDTQQANRAIDFLSRKQPKPFFLTIGFYRPHTLRIVPKRYFDLYPLDSIRIPEGYLPGDLDDVPGPGRWLSARLPFHAAITGAGLWRDFLQAKYAATSYVDDQIGRVIAALEKGPNAQRTYIVFLADNGYDTGEKDKWSKYALWEHTCRVVFSISGPGIARRDCPSPVSLLDLYPTLLGLTGVPQPDAQQLDGVDLTPVLHGVRTGRGRPVVTTYGPGNHSIRDDRYRYIRYRNGDEELYDHDSDPYEWTNRSSDPALAAAKASLAAFLPPASAPESERSRKPDPGELTEEVYRRWEPDWNRTRMFNQAKNAPAAPEHE